MSTYSTSDFKSGLKIILDGEPCSIISNEFVKPGKGQAFNRVRIKKLISNKIFDKTYKSGEKVEAADVMSLSVLFLYSSANIFYFMEEKNFMQYDVSADVVGSSALFLVDQCSCSITLWNDRVISVELPNFVNLEIIETEPGLKGDSQGTAFKDAKIVTGAIIRVPLFIKSGDLIKIDTRTKSYIERVKV